MLARAALTALTALVAHPGGPAAAAGGGPAAGALSGPLPDASGPAEPAPAAGGASIVPGACPSGAGARSWSVLSSGPFASVTGP